MTGIVGDTYGLLAAVYFCRRCVLLFKVRVREASVLAEFKAALQNRHSKIKSA